jgi:hypothetical protein
MKKYSGKIQNPVPLATIREVKVELPNWDWYFFHPNRSCCISLIRMQKICVDWYQYYENRLTGLKVMAFFSSKIGKKSFSTFFIYFKIFALVFDTNDLNTWNLDWICKTRLPTIWNKIWPASFDFSTFCQNMVLFQLL